MQSLGELSGFLGCLCHPIHLMGELLGRLCSLGASSQSTWGACAGPCPRWTSSWGAWSLWVPRGHRQPHGGSPVQAALGCRAAQVLMQYCILANHYWFLVEAVYLYKLLIGAVFSEKNYYRLYLYLGWGRDHSGTVGTGTVPGVGGTAVPTRPGGCGVGALPPWVSLPAWGWFLSSGGCLVLQGLLCDFQGPPWCLWCPGWQPST